MKLNVTQYGESINDDKLPIIILHGLFGSHRNWQPIAKKLSEKHLIYSLDLRNHGQSPHADMMDYPAMAQDIVEFIEEKSLHKQQPSVSIIAHSMGGKAALWLALKRPELIKKLVIIDIAPVSYQHEFEEVLKGFNSIPLYAIKSRQDADEWLAKSINDQLLRQFLLQNLQFKNEKYQWRLNLAAISHSIPVLTGFPDTAGIAPYTKRVLFIGGGQSDYLTTANQKLTRQLFPQASFSMIKSAGHWLHAEQPELFIALIEPYMSQS